VLRDRPVSVTAEDGLKALALCVAAEKSHIIGAAVKIEP
jgi:hypothetical protein